MSTFLLRFPSLSPTCKGGKIEKLYISIGQQVKPYDLIMKVSTETLLKDENKISYLDIELVEDVFVSKILAEEGVELNIGDPIAILTEDEKSNNIDPRRLPIWQAYTS